MTVCTATSLPTNCKHPPQKRHVWRPKTSCTLSIYPMNWSPRRPFLSYTIKRRTYLLVLKLTCSHRKAYTSTYKTGESLGIRGRSAHCASQLESHSIKLLPPAFQHSDALTSSLFIHARPIFSSPQWGQLPFVIFAGESALRPSHQTRATSMSRKRKNFGKLGQISATCAPCSPANFTPRSP
jgi:hypothetical protein